MDTSQPTWKMMGCITKSTASTTLLFPLSKVGLVTWLSSVPLPVSLETCPLQLPSPTSPSSWTRLQVTMDGLRRCTKSLIVQQPKCHISSIILTAWTPSTSTALWVLSEEFRTATESKFSPICKSPCHATHFLLSTAFSWCRISCFSIQLPQVYEIRSEVVFRLFPFQPCTCYCP